jgi:hypothetical protein
MTLVFLNKDKNAANKSNSATVRVQEHPKVTLLAKVCNIVGDAQEVASVVLKTDAANSGAPMEYHFVLSTGSVGKGVCVLKTPLELIAKRVHAVLDVKRLLDK